MEETILHEIAHAWAAHNLSDDQRQAFVDLRGLDTWFGDAPWHERGSEQAAVIIAWGLGETSRRPTWMPNRDLDSLTKAFNQLVGTDPITDTSNEWR